jgi:hypothetical protein
VTQPTNWIPGVLLLAMIWPMPAGAQTPAVRSGMTPPAAVGPGSLKAMSQHPAEIYLVWPPVPAIPQAYRVTRLDRAGGTEQVVAEGPASSFGLGGNNCAAGSGLPSCFFVDHKVSTAYLYSYRVWAIYPGSVVSPPSPVAAARPVFVAPANLRSTTAAAPPASVMVTLRWDPVYGAVSYAVVPNGLAPATTTSLSATYTMPKSAGQLSVCVNPVYPNNLRDDSVRSCLTVPL